MRFCQLDESLVGSGKSLFILFLKLNQDLYVFVLLRESLLLLRESLLVLSESLFVLSESFLVCSESLFILDVKVDEDIDFIVKFPHVASRAPTGSHE